MGLGDLMGALRLEWFAEIGLGISLSGFAAVLVSVLLRRNRRPFERARWLPLAAEARGERGGEGRP